MDNTTRLQTYACEYETVTAQLRASLMNVCDIKYLPFVKGRC